MEITFELNELNKCLPSNCILDKEILENVINKYNKKNNKLGELPASTESNISLINVSHEIKNVKLVDDKLIIDINILNTPRGQIASQLLNSGYKLKIWPRIFYNADQQDDKLIITSFDIITFDLT